MTTTSAASAPRSLGAEGRRLWGSITRHWADDGLVPDARELRLLEDACREADVLAKVSAALDASLEEGDMIVKGSTGQPVSNPLIGEARRSRAQIASLLGKLGMEPPRSAETSVGMSVTEAGRLGGMARRHGRDGLGR